MRGVLLARQLRTIYRDLEALHAAGFPLYNEKVERSIRWAFIDTFKFKIPPFLSRKAAKFAKKKFFNFPTLQIYLFQILGRISKENKDLCVLGAFA
jgi:hypothetical protein